MPKTKMALPTLQPYWMKNYKSRSEGLLVRRTQHEADRREAWETNAKYFQRSNVEATKQRAWGSKISYQESMEALGDMYKKNTKSDKHEMLEERRKELSKLLLKEKKEYEAELRERRLGGAGGLVHMKDRAEELKSQRESKRKEIAEQKMYEHWKQNAPELRQVESDQLKQYVVEGWTEQISDKEQHLKTAREEDKRVDAAMEKDRQLAIRKEKEKEEAKQREEKEVASDLQKQMKELRLREEESLMLKREQEIITDEQWKLEQAEEERRQLEEARRKRELGRVLIRQHKAQMKRKSQQIQEALELDLKILESLSAKEEQSKDLQTARREKARADAKYMKEVVAQQLRLEQEREADLDMLYKDEAARMWSKREAEWERERQARERLMAEVLQGRKRQLEGRMEENRRRQLESIESREELVRELESAQRMTAREKKEEEMRRREREEEIQAQLTSRKEKAVQERVRQRKELERQRGEEVAYDKMIKGEAARMTARGPQPRFVPRRRTAFE